MSPRTASRAPEFVRNLDLEALLGELNEALAPVAAASAERHREPARPVTFIVGPPRAGSTFLLQQLAATGEYAYPSNLLARFHSTPYLGALVHRMLLDDRFDHRAEMAAVNGEIAFESDLGKTRGPANVNEFWYAWRRFLPDPTSADEWTEAELATIDTPGLRAMVAGLEAGFGLPVVMKAHIMDFHLDLLADAFPQATFLRLRRERNELVESVLSARERFSGDREAWWSLRPRNWEDLLGLPPRQQVEAQVDAIETAIDRAVAVVGADRFTDVDHGELTGRAPAARAPGARRERPDQPVDETHLVLYGREAFGRRNLPSGARWLRFDHFDGDRLVGSIPGTLVGGLFWSGYSAPFVGPDLVRARATATEVADLLADATEQARSVGAERMRVSLRPPSYGENEALVVHEMLKAGFGVQASELSCSIDLRAMRGPDDYVASLKRESRKALRRAEAEPWEYRELVRGAEWRNGYELLRCNRSRKGRSLRLSLEYIVGVAGDFPGRLRMFGLFHDGGLVASALLYRLTDEVESVQYWGDEPGELRRSPMNRLAAEVCWRAIEEGISNVDLGKSSVDGVVDDGLVRFKRSVGAESEPMIVLERGL